MTTNNPNAAPFKLEKDVPMPSRASGGGKPKYPWSSMEEGDSFFVAGAKIETFYTLTSTARKKYNANFVARKWQEDGVNGVRVWRI